MTFFVSNGITKPIIHIKELIEKASNGNLSLVSSYNSENELGRLSSGFNGMISNMRNLVVEIIEASKLTYNSSEVITSTSEETAASIEEIARAISGVAEGVNNQVQNIQRGVEITSRLSTELDLIAHQIEQSKTASSHVTTANNEGLKAINLLKEKSEENSKATKMWKV